MRKFVFFRVLPRFFFHSRSPAFFSRGGHPSLSPTQSVMSPPAVLPVNEASQQHAPSNGSHEPQEDYWREQQGQEASSSRAAPIPQSSTHADLLFPPCFITLAGLACWHAPRSPPLFFSAPVLLIIFIPCYVLGVFLFVVKLGKFAPPQARLPGSRLVAASAASLLSASFFSFVAWQLPLIWNDEKTENERAILPLLRLRLRLECATLIFCFSLFLVLQYLLAVADPGRVEKKERENGSIPNHHAGSCATCTTLRPLRSKHCRACGVCVKLFDHHCPVVANCVGSRTLSKFLFFLKVTATGQFLMLRLACVAAFIAFAGGTEKEKGISSSSSLSVLAAASTRARGQLLLCVVQVPIFLSTLFLVARGAFCAAANLTVNELANRERYAYLRHNGDGRGQGEATSFHYCNRFDRGVARNLASFCGLGDLVISTSSSSSSSSSPSSRSSPHDNHYWSERLDEALTEHGPGGVQPPPLGTRVVRWLDGIRDNKRRRRRRRKNSNKEEGGDKKVSSENGSGAGAAAPSVDVELAPLWDGGGGITAATTTL